MWTGGRPCAAPRRAGPCRRAGCAASIGANLALATGAADPEVTALTLLSPGLDCFRVSLMGAVEAYGERALFLAAAEDDPYYAVTVQALAEAAPGPTELLVLPTAGHGTDMLQSAPELSERLLEFLTAALAR